MRILLCRVPRIFHHPPLITARSRCLMLNRRKSNSAAHFVFCKSYSGFLCWNQRKTLFILKASSHLGKIYSRRKILHGAICILLYFALRTFPHPLLAAPGSIMVYGLNRLLTRPITKSRQSVPPFLLHKLPWLDYHLSTSQTLHHRTVPMVKVSMVSMERF